jgi:hypothetical protein
MHTHTHAHTHTHFLKQSFPHCSASVYSLTDAIRHDENVRSAPKLSLSNSRSDFRDAYDPNFSGLDDSFELSDDNRSRDEESVPSDTRSDFISYHGQESANALPHRRSDANRSRDEESISYHGQDSANALPHRRSDDNRSRDEESDPKDTRSDGISYHGQDSANALPHRRSDANRSRDEESDPKDTRSDGISYEGLDSANSLLRRRSDDNRSRNEESDPKDTRSDFISYEGLDSANSLLRRRSDDSVPSDTRSAFISYEGLDFANALPHRRSDDNSSRDVEGDESVPAIDNVVPLLPHVENESQSNDQGSSMEEKRVQIRQVAAIGDAGVRKCITRSLEKKEQTLANGKSAAIKVKCSAAPKKVVKIKKLSAAELKKKRNDKFYEGMDLDEAEDLSV